MNDFHYNREFPVGAGDPDLYDLSSGLWLPGSSRMREEEKERDYWHQLYPAEVKRIQRAVERACDQVDYEGSFLYDEYPDRVVLQRMCEGIGQTLAGGQTGPDRLAKAAGPGVGPGGGADGGRPGSDPSWQHLIRVLLFDEISCRRRNRRRYWSF